MDSGLGIVFFTIAILPSLVGGSLKVFAAEATGPIKSKLHPRLSMGAKWIWMVYFVLTAACVVSYKVCGMNWFDAFNYAMTSTATGGFQHRKWFYCYIPFASRRVMSVLSFVSYRA